MRTLRDARNNGEGLRCSTIKLDNEAAKSEYPVLKDIVKPQKEFEEFHDWLKLLVMSCTPTIRADGSAFSCLFSSELRKLTIAKNSAYTI